MTTTLTAPKPPTLTNSARLYADVGILTGIRADISAALAAARWWMRGQRTIIVHPEDLQTDAGVSAPAKDTNNNIAATVALSASKALVQRFSLPVSAKRHLRDIIENKIRQLTPFEPDDVYFGYDIKPASGKMISVQMVAAPKSTCDQAISSVRKAGYSVDMVMVDGVESINILPNHILDAPTTDPSLQRLLKINLALIIILGLLVFGGGFSRLAWASVEAVSAEKSATDVLEARRETLVLTGKMTPLSALTKSAPDSAALLNALAASLGDDVWLDRVTIDREKIDIQGYASSSSTVLSAVDALPGVTKVAFRSTVMRDVTTGKERFQIRASMVAAP